MSHRTRLVLPALALLAALGGRSVVADDGSTTKEFGDKEFSITVPKDWTVEDVTGPDAEAGFVCKAKHAPYSTGVEANVWVLVKPAGGATAQDMISLARDTSLKELKDGHADEVKKVAWGGDPNARTVRLFGKAANGSKRVSRIYASVVNGNYHQLDLRTFNGAEEKAAADLDAIAKSYKLLALAASGAGGGEGPAPGGEGGAGGGDAPAAADARTVVFDHRGFRWTLPPAPDDATKPRWDVVADSNADPHRTLTDDGLLARGELHTAETIHAVILIIGPHTSGGSTDAKAFANTDGNFKDLITENFEGNPSPDIDEDVRIGNIHGASRSLFGKSKDGRVLWIKCLFAVSHDALTLIRIAAWDKAERTFKADIEAALKGISWDDSKEGLRGPWGSALPASTLARKEEKTLTPEHPYAWEDAGKVSNMVVAGLSGTKPAAFARVKFPPEANEFQGIVYMAEGRKPNGYMYFEIRRIPARAFTDNKPQKPIESLIDDHEIKWKDSVTDPKTLTQKGGKANKTAGEFKGNKGFKYEFTGTGAEQPVLDRGWVFKEGQNVYWIRTQYVGAEAEKAFDADWSAFVKSLKFD